MIIKESFEPIELALLVSRLSNVLSVSNLHRVDFGYDTDNRSFIVNYWTRPKSFKPVTIAEERAVASGGKHATPSECYL